MLFSIPIKKQEIPRFLIISLMMLMILFIYSVQRNVKDTLIVSDLGAGAIPTIKLWVVTPLAVLFLLVYAKLSDLVNKTTIFHAFNLFFISYFLVFTFIIQKNLSLFHLDLSNFKSSYLIFNASIFQYFFLVAENWSYVIYFAFAELWGSVMLALMFWQIANQVFKLDEARRLYPLFGLLAQFGLILSSFVIKFSRGYALTWEKQLIIINVFVVIAALILSFSFRFLYTYVVSYDNINAETIKKKKKLPFMESLRHVFTSKYIGLIAALIVCYGISTNLVEVLWKNQIGAIYADKADYSNYIANSQLYTALSSMLIMLSGSYILRSITWKCAAMITPIIVTVTGILFFSFSLFRDKLYLAITFLAISPLSFTAAVGLVQNVLSKSTKYAFFDATKEMTYIPLDDELKSKGKAAADVIGGRLGKAGGSFILWLLLLIPSTTIESITPVVFYIFLMIVLVWFLAINSLSIEFYRRTKKM